MQLMTIKDLPQEFLSILGEVQNLTFPKQGCTSDVAVVESTTGRYVVKRARGEQYSSWLAEEYRVLTALAPLPLTIIPKPYQFTRQVLPAGEECWLLMDYLPGVSVGERLLASNSLEERQAILHSFGRALALLHMLPVPPELPCDTPWLPQMLEQAEFNLQHFPVDGSKELFQQLQENRPVHVQPQLIHGDYTIDNVLMVGSEVTGIIDWSGGAYGDPRYDIALAIRPQAEGFQTPEDVQAFYAGYQLATLSEEELQYFVDLYEFF